MVEFQLDLIKRTADKYQSINKPAPGLRRRSASCNQLLRPGCQWQCRQTETSSSRPAPGCNGTPHSFALLRFECRPRYTSGENSTLHSPCVNRQSFPGPVQAEETGGWPPGLLCELVTDFLAPDNQRAGAASGWWNPASTCRSSDYN